MSKLKAQVLVVVLFALSISMTLLFFLYVPVRNQVLRVKTMDYSFAAISKAMSALEVSFYEVQTGQDISPIFQEKSNVTDSTADQSFCNGVSCCRREVKANKSGYWQREMIFYYNCSSGTSGSRNVFNALKINFTVQGEEHNVVRSLFFTF